MRVIKKLCALVYALAVAAQAATLAILSFGTPPMREHVLSIIGRPAGAAALVVCMVLMAVGALILFVRILAFQRPPESVHPGGDPAIEVRLQAVSSVARSAAEECGVMVDRVSTRVTGKDGDGVRIALDVIAFTNDGLSALGAHIKAYVEDACGKFLGAGGTVCRVRFLPARTTTIIKEAPREQA